MKNMVVYAAVDDVRSSLHSMGLAWGDFSHTLSGASHFVGNVEGLYGTFPSKDFFHASATDLCGVRVLGGVLYVPLLIPGNMRRKCPALVGGE